MLQWANYKLGVVARFNLSLTPEGIERIASWFSSRKLAVLWRFSCCTFSHFLMKALSLSLP